MNVERGMAVALVAVGTVLAGVVAAAGTDSTAPKPKPATQLVKPATPPTPAGLQSPPVPPVPEKDRVLTQEEMTANWQRALTPGAEHKLLENFVGHWAAHVRLQMDPSRPPQESDGTADGQLVLGGRFVQVTHKGTMNGQPFEGMMLAGYDNLAKKYVATWVDNMGTAIVHYDGSADRNTHRLMMGARFVDPRTLKPARTLAVTTFVSATSWTYEEFNLGVDGADQLVLTITFKKI
jgi:hypothetical protein